MKTTNTGQLATYLGADLTDRYSKACRPTEVCGLELLPTASLSASFWQWEWDRGPEELDVHSILPELRSARSSMFDGPQGLATRGKSLRACERHSSAAGKTPDVRPARSKPFATYIWSSLDLFNALHSASIMISPPNFISGVSEVYPAHIWRILADRVLPKKKSKVGRLLRKRLLEDLGIWGLPDLPSHDQNDACIAAVLAAAADGKIQGMKVGRVGEPLAVDATGVLREGQMAIPVIDSSLRKSLNAVCRTSEPGGSTSELQLRISHAEAMVLFEFLSRFSESARLSIEDQAEERVLWNLCCDLEQQLSEPFGPSYTKILEAARAAVRDIA